MIEEGVPVKEAAELSKDQVEDFKPFASTSEGQAALKEWCTSALNNGLPTTSEAPGASPEGGPFGGLFQEGQTLQQPIYIQPSKCYTVVAAAMGVQEVSVQIVVQLAPGYPPKVPAPRRR